MAAYAWRAGRCRTDLHRDNRHPLDSGRADHLKGQFVKVFSSILMLLVSTAAANAQYYRGGYVYPGRGYYSDGRYSEHYGRQYGGCYGCYAPRPAPRPSYAPRGGYDFSWGGGNRGYLGGRGGGWGGEW